MVHLIKIGVMYLTAAGDWSPCQKDAMRISNLPFVRSAESAGVRVVRLKTRADRLGNGAATSDLAF
jgi:hypothetical protein